ncbi:MAG: NAD-dependent epimerase/dehydratase family protein [Spirochaetes bacterium]|nr:NAD-dependent epimerase/dehydratase family protein [Spirochaetota bacterium]
MQKKLEIKKIGIFGGTGFIGSNIVYYLNNNINNINRKSFHTQNYELIFNIDEIIIFFSKTRWNNLTKDIENKLFKYVKIDIFNYSELIEKTKELDVVINCSGFVSFTKKDKESLWKINVYGAKNILKASIQNKIKRFIHVSSISILNLMDTSHYLNENDIGLTQYEKKFHSFSSNEEILTFEELYEKGDKSFLKFIKNPYADSKLAGYIVCKDLAQNNEIDFINVIPGTVVGKGDINLSITKLVYNIDKNFIFGTLPGFSSFVDSIDLAKGIFNSLIYGKNLENYIISGDIENNLSYNEFIQKIYKILKDFNINRDNLDKINNKTKTNKIRYNKIFLKLPKLITYPLSIIAENIFNSRNLTYSLIKSGYIKSKIEIEKAKNELNYKPETSIEESIKKLCEDYFNYDIAQTIKHKNFFFFIKKYFSDPWVKRNGIIFVNGIENIYESKKRVYVVNHPTTYDIHTIINISDDNFYIPIDYKAYKVPIVSWVLTNCGFPQVYPKDNKHILPAMSKALNNGYAVFNSIRGGDVTLGLDERIRTGAAVMADINQADLIPYHIYIEKGKKKFGKVPGINFKIYPYTFYKNAIVIVNILPPLKWKDYHKENMSKEDYYKIMEEIDKQFIQKDKEMENLFEEKKEEWKNLKRKGGSQIKIKY